MTTAQKLSKTRRNPATYLTVFVVLPVLMTLATVLCGCGDDAQPAKGACVITYTSGSISGAHGCAAETTEQECKESSDYWNAQSQAYANTYKWYKGKTCAELGY